MGCAHPPRVRAVAVRPRLGGTSLPLSRSPEYHPDSGQRSPAHHHRPHRSSPERDRGGLNSRDRARHRVGSRAAAAGLAAPELHGSADAARRSGPAGRRRRGDRHGRDQVVAELHELYGAGNPGRLGQRGSRSVVPDELSVRPASGPSNPRAAGTGCRPCSGTRRDRELRIVLAAAAAPGSRPRQARHPPHWPRFMAAPPPAPRSTGRRQTRLVGEKRRLPNCRVSTLPRLVMLCPLPATTKVESQRSTWRS